MSLHASLPISVAAVGHQKQGRNSRGFLPQIQTPWGWKTKERRSSGSFSEEEGAATPSTLWLTSGL